MKELFKKYLYSKITQAEFEHLCGFMLDKDNSNILNDIIDAELESSLGKQEGPIASQSKVYQKILQQVMQDQVKNSKRKLRLFSIGLRVAALLVCGLIFSSIWFFLQSNNRRHTSSRCTSVPGWRLCPICAGATNSPGRFWRNCWSGMCNQYPAYPTGSGRHA